MIVSIFLMQVEENNWKLLCIGSMSWCMRNLLCSIGSMSWRMESVREQLYGVCRVDLREKHCPCRSSGFFPGVNKPPPSPARRRPSFLSEYFSCDSSSSSLPSSSKRKRQVLKKKRCDVRLLCVRTEVKAD